MWCWAVDRPWLMAVHGKPTVVDVESMVRDGSPLVGVPMVADGSQMALSRWRLIAADDSFTAVYVQSMALDGSPWRCTGTSLTVNR